VRISLNRSLSTSTSLFGRQGDNQPRLSGEAALFCGTTLRPRSLKLLLTNKEIDLPGAVPFLNRLTD
jgi:hypothetical protein